MKHSLSLLAGLLLLAVPPATNGAVTIIAAEVGDDVVITATGTLDLTGMTLDGAVNTGLGVVPNNGLLVLGSGGVSDVYVGLISAPSSFGTMSTAFGDGGSGTTLRLEPGELAVAQGFSGGAFSASVFFNDEDFATIGLTPGVYAWVLPNDTITFVIPEPSRGLLSLLALGAMLVRRRRR